MFPRASVSVSTSTNLIIFHLFKTLKSQNQTNAYLIIEGTVHSVLFCTENIRLVICERSMHFTSKKDL